MDVTDPIRRVSAVSTDQVQIRPDHLAADRLLYGRPARFEISPTESLSAGLGQLGYACGKPPP